MRILVTNDDGIDAAGLHAVVGALVDAGHETTVAAPASDRSGSGAGLGSIDHGAEIRYDRCQLPGLPDVDAVRLDAPPAFAVLAACSGLFGPRPDVVVSGINDGYNTGRMILTSSTVGAVLAAGTLGARGLAISAGFAPHNRFDTAARVAVETVRWLVEESGPRTVLNVNVPDLAVDDLRGVRLAPLAARGLMGLHLERTDDVVRLHRFENDERLGEATDSAYVRDGFVAISVLETVASTETDVDPAAAVAAGLTLAATAPAGPAC